jgi:hypothetical protein
VEVGAANANRGHPHDDLVRPRLGKIDLEDLERLPDAVEERRPRLQDSTSAVRIRRLRIKRARP